MSERRALVVGAGYVGGVCCDILCKNGWQVWALRRSGHFAEPIRTVKADVSELSALRAAVGPEAAKGGFDAVVYAVSADERTDEAYRAADALHQILR